MPEPGSPAGLTADARVVVIGQIARDIVLRVAQAPGPGTSAAVTERLEALGGKGANQAAGMAQLGLRPVLVAAVGDDEPGQALLDQALADGIELAEAGDPGRRQELATKYGVTYSADWVAELTSRYNLKLLGH